MKEIISTKKFPVRFFKEFFLNGQFQNYKDDFIQSCFEIKRKNPDNVDIIDTGSDIVMNYWITRNPGPGDEGLLDSKLSSKLMDLLEEEVKRSKALLLDAVTINHVSANNFLYTQQVIIKDIIAATKKLNESSVCVPYLDDLYRYIQKMIKKFKQPSRDKEQKVINKSDQEKARINSTQDELEDDPFNEILGYLKGKDESGRQIMFNADFNSLIEQIKKIINNEEVIIQKKLEIHVPVMVLKYTFYVLHLRLFGNKKNDRFIHFLHDAILTFEKWDFKPFKCKISEPPSKFPSYIPQIIIDQRKRQTFKEK